MMVETLTLLATGGGGAYAAKWVVVELEQDSQGNGGPAPSATIPSQGNIGGDGPLANAGYRWCGWSNVLGYAGGGNFPVQLV